MFDVHISSSCSIRHSLGYDICSHIIVLSSPAYGPPAVVVHANQVPTRSCLPQTCQDQPSSPLHPVPDYLSGHPLGHQDGQISVHCFPYNGKTLLLNLNVIGMIVIVQFKEQTICYWCLLVV